MQLRTVGVTADLTIRVPRDRDEDLEDGARRLLRRVEAVTEVEQIELQGVQPRLNDLAIEVRAELRFEVEPPDCEDGATVERELDDGFGLSVETIRAVG